MRPSQFFVFLFAVAVSALPSTVVSINEGSISTAFTLPDLSIPAASLTIKSPSGSPTATVILTLTHTSTNSVGATIVHDYPTNNIPGASNTDASNPPPVVTGAATNARPVLAGAVGLLGAGAFGLAAVL